MPRLRHPPRGVAFVACVLLTSIASAGGPAPFTEEALARGLSFNMVPYPQPQGYLGQGVGFSDLDQDGDPDVLVVGRVDGRIGVFENVGGSFLDRTLTSGLPAMNQQQGFAAADYDGDGDPDLYLTQANNQPNFLMRNDGGFSFTNVTGPALVSDGLRNTTAATWADYNGDGWLDLYVCNYGQTNALYRNNGNGTFTNRAIILGVAGPPTALSFQSVWSDYDRDGDLDLYVSNDRAVIGQPPNMLWRNDGGTFTDVSDSSGADVAIYSMGIGAGDIDDNGFPDFYVTNVNGYDSGGGGVGYDGQNPLLLNDGNGAFTDEYSTWGVGNGITSWAAIFFDWDNDGFDDLYVNNQFEPNSFFDCDATPPCTESAATLMVQAAYDPDYDPVGDPPTIASYSSAVGDVDDDGDLDLIVNNLGHRVELFINQEGQTRDAARYRIVGEHPNLHAIGATVETTSDGKTQMHEIFAGGNGYLTQNEPVVHVGLGNAEAVEQTVVHWPGGTPTRTLTGLPAGEIWSIYPPGRLCDFDGDGMDADDFVEFSVCFLTGFSVGCEMMDAGGDSRIWADDLETCFVTAPADCNDNGTEDLAEIVLDLSLDTNGDGVIDCCAAGPTDEPNPVGPTLLLGKDLSVRPVLSWTAPEADGSHAAATSYDVFHSAAAEDGFAVLANTATTSMTDTDAPAVRHYLVGARNGCGSSGEEPF
jgi:hypothetical protein